MPYLSLFLFGGAWHMLYDAFLVRASTLGRIRLAFLLIIIMVFQNMSNDFISIDTNQEELANFQVRLYNIEHKF